ncbi:MAG: hypothetical protein ACK5TK_13335 [Betaproteobacteria bacterium]
MTLSAPFRFAFFALAAPMLALAASSPHKASPTPPPPAAVPAPPPAFVAAAQRLQERWKAAAPKASDPAIRLLAGSPFAAGEIERIAASAASDPLVLYWLQAACTAEPRPAGCPTKAAAVTMTQVDPDNAVGWIERFNAASASGNAVDADASLARAAQARRYDLRQGELLKRLADFARQIDAEATLPVVVAVTGNALRPQQLARLLDACRPPAAGEKRSPLADSRRKQCWTIFETMATRGTDVGAAWTAASVMRRLATTDAEKKRAADLRLRASRLSAATAVGPWATLEARTSLSPQGPWSLYLADLIAVGEIAAVERALARSGMKLEDIDPNQPMTPMRR